jgi:hypothetical protein
VRADRAVAMRPPTGLGGRLGGGPFPVEVRAEVATLRTQLETDALAGDRLAGIDRLVGILASHGRQPVFVLEDTEAAVGGADRDEVIDGFFSGPIHAFVKEVDAACLLAVQDHIAEHPAFRALASSVAQIELPRFADGRGSAVTTRSVRASYAGRPVSSSSAT